ncbi:hypothetical protein [Candidatus Nitrosocosmicus arcticus]|uniref:Uncharacterized protein n=1 Tax=Candidatus Nitrosocosmicus arcticus TaxID=2035267 RepID=A0A557SWB9_9ARCH|nr:hypothetical protein [Candidatus Nitrosocosmicus arcticus]TVP40893.1 hypothetical protein NARC_50074 [Candidatus Nitrosocosmicus arcticus]
MKQVAKDEQVDTSSILKNVVNGSIIKRFYHNSKKYSKKAGILK